MRTQTRKSLLCLCVISLVPGAVCTLHAQTATAAQKHVLAVSKGAAHTAAPDTVSVNAAESGKETSRRISVTVGTSIVLDTPKPIKRISLGLGEYAEASAVSPTEILINGKAPGETSLILWDVTGAREFIHIMVLAGSAAVEDHLDSVRRELKSELPNESLTVTAANGNVFLRGTVKDLNSSDRAAQIASTAGKVVNLLYVAVPPGDPQIMLKVRFASVDRTLSKQLGINVFSSGLGNVIGTVSTGQSAATTVTTTNTGATVSTSTSDPNIVAYFPGLNMGATIQALETKGVVQVLAEPNLMATSGQQASFLAGGEYPYPIAQAASGGTPTITISFKEYGIRLSFVPTITARGTIRLQVAPEVSSLDFTNAVTISGFEVPAIATRKVKTEVELSDGQSFVIGGLLDNRENETFQKVPFLGSIPVLGKLFQSISRTKSNTELIVMVTTEIVAPIQAGAALPELKYPEKFLKPNSDIPMSNPDGGADHKGPAPPPPTMPLELLLDSMKPEKPLTDTSSSSSSNGASSSPK